MKLFLVTFLMTATALAADTAKTTETSTTTPKQACEALAKAAAEDNFKAFSEWTAMPAMMDHEGMACDHKKCKDKNCPMHKKGKEHHHAGMPSEEGFHKMHQKEMARLKDLSCKDEKIAGDHAWVEAISQNESRLVPFRMEDGKWKFDIHAYHAFYHSKMMK